MHPSFPFDNQPPTAPPTAAISSAEDDELLAMAISASLQSATPEAQANSDAYLGSEAGPSSSTPISNTGASSTSHEASGSKYKTPQAENNNAIPPTVQTTPSDPPPTSAPSAPPASDAAIVNGPVTYPSIDTSPIDLSSSTTDAVSGGVDSKKGDENSTASCTICLDAPLEGACVPCGHLAGCMSCLKEIKSKNWGCPVCRSKIDQIIRIYAVV